MNDPRPLRGLGPALLARIAANPVAGSPADMRRAFAAIAGPQPTLGQRAFGGVPCIVAGDGAPGAVWLHGGGYVMGGAESHGRSIAHLAARLGRAVVMPLYARAPERPWPAQKHDALAVIDALPPGLPVLGDSAGGHLALHAAFARPGGIGALALIGPNTDRSGLSRSRAANSATDPMNDDATDAHLADLALPGADPFGPDASPVLGPLDRLPRSYITWTANEVLADDAAILADRAADQGVDITRRVERDLAHMWTLWPRDLPAAAQTLDRIAAWLRRGG